MQDATTRVVFEALIGFKMAAGSTRSAAEAFATANTQRGLALFQGIIDKGLGLTGSPRHDAFAALKKLAAE